MNKLISALMLVSSLVLAQSIPTQQITAVETSNEFIVAQSQYKLGDYTSSYQQFKKLFLKHTDNAQVNFYLAMSAMELKLYDEATAAFERVLIVQPDFHRARLEFARLQFLLGFKEEAKKEFLKVAQYPIPENVRKNIDYYLKQIDNKDVNSTFIALSFGYMYDDNINSGVEYDSYNLPGFYNLSVSGAQPQSSTAYTTSFQINHIHSLSDDLPFIVKHTGTMFYKNQTENDLYNFSYFAYTPTIFYNDVANNNEYSLQFGVEKIYPGDRVDFSTYFVSPKYRMLINKDTVFSTYVEYKEVHYEEVIDKDKGYNKKTLGTSLKYKNFEYQLSFEKDDKEFGDRSDVNKNITSNAFLYQYDIQSTLFLNLKYQYNKVKYNDKDVFFANSRIDNQNVYSIGLTKVINKTDFVTLSYTKTNNSTNQQAYEYDKDTVYLNYNWRFKL